MKLGCLIRFLFIGFLLIGSAYYIYQKYGAEIVEYGENELMVDEMENILKTFDKETYKDSLKAFIIRNSINFDKMKSSIESINKEIKSVDADSVRLQKIKQMLLKNER